MLLAPQSANIEKDDLKGYEDIIKDNELCIVLPYSWYSLDDDADPDVTIWHVRTALKNFPTDKKIPNQCNMRFPGNNAGISKILRKSAEQDSRFGLKNLGITIACSQVFLLPNNQILLVFEKLDRYGIFNGGHTTNAIQSDLEKGILTLDNWVYLRIYEGTFDTDESVDLMTALNSVRAPKKYQISDARGHYSTLTDAAYKTPFEGWADKIKFPEGGSGPVNTMGQIIAAYYFKVSLPTLMKEGKTPEYLLDTKHEDRTTDDIRKDLRKIAVMFKNIDKIVTKAGWEGSFKMTKVGDLKAVIPPKGFMTGLLRAIQDQPDIEVSDEILQKLIVWHINYVANLEDKSVVSTLQSDAYYTGLSDLYKKLKALEVTEE